MRGMNAENGKPISHDAHLMQSVIDILSTPIGSRVLNREYGSLLPTLIDNPQDGTTRMRVIAASAGALSRWEPRIQVTRIQVTYPSIGVFNLTIVGTNKETGKQVVLTGVTINGQ